MRSTQTRWRRWAVLSIVFTVALLRVIVAFAVLIVTAIFLFGDRSTLLVGIPWPWNGVVIYGSAILLFWGFTRLLGVRWTDVGMMQVDARSKDGQARAGRIDPPPHRD